MKFNTMWDNESGVVEKNNGPYLVMTAGFVPDDLRIKELLIAGNRVEAYKLGDNFTHPEYDIEAEDGDVDSIDDYMDEMEAQDALNEANRRIASSIKAREEFYSRRLREENKAAKAEPKQPTTEPQA